MAQVAGSGTAVDMVSPPTGPVLVLANCRVGHELMLVRTISLDLLSNVFVEMSEPFVRHMFDTHNQPLFNSTSYPSH